MSVSDLSPHFDLSLLDRSNKNGYGHIFSRVLELSAPKNILEIGFFTGNSALCWLELSGANLTSVDPMVAVGNMNFDGKMENVEILKGHFGDRFTFLRKDSRLVRPDLAGQSFDLMFIDGDHSADGVANDLQLSLDLNIPWVFVDDFGGDVSSVFDSQFSRHFDLVADFGRYSVPVFVGMKLFKRKST